MAKEIIALKDLKWIVSVEELSRDIFRFEAHAVYEDEKHERVSGLLNNELIGDEWDTKRAATKSWICFAKTNEILNYEFK